MIVSDYAIDRRTTVFVLLALIIVTGLFSYWVLPREDNPEVVIPILLVTTTYEGVSPEDMEALVTIPIERKLTGLSGVKQIESTSAEGFSFIQIEFEADEDIDEARQRVRDKVDQAEADIPPETDDPIIDEVNVSELPIMFVSLTGDVGLALLTNFAKDLEDEIESIKGVLDVKIVGDVEREIQIIVDPDRAAEYGVSMADLVTLARVENVNTPAGSLELGEAKFLVRVPGEFTGADDIKNLVVKANPDGVVYVRDIAEVRDGFKDIESISRIDGRQTVTLTVSKRAGENVIRITDEVRAVSAAFEEGLLPGMDIVITMDESEEIRDMVAELENSILTGLILVLVVIFIFLGFTNSIMVALAIPFSMLITFAALYITDTTLNTQFIGQTVLAAINGRKAGDYREGDEEYDVTVCFPKPFREDLVNLQSMTLVNLAGVPVPFSSVAQLEYGSGYGAITRVDRKRTVTVSAETEGRSGAEVLKDVRARLDDADLPPGYRLSYTGENEEQEEAQSFLVRAFIVALFLIALVLVTQFNSVVQPFIIMSSVILSLAGVFLGLYLTGMAFSVIMTGIGCISLAGVVVNNAIVLIDFINQRRREGLAPHAAIVDAGVTRFRPVMLTAITTILGLIPMAVGFSFDFRNWTFISGGESSQWWGPMAIAVIFGLAFATLLTLIVVPTLYSLSVSLSRFLGHEDIPGSIA